MERNLKTPYFMIKEKELKDNIKKLHKALKETWGNYIIGYSCKTNSLPWILKFMQNNNCYAEVVSDSEYELVRKIGFGTNQIIFNGPNKGKDSFINAIKSGSIVNIDSNREIQWIKEQEFNNEVFVGIRVNFDLDKECPNETSYGKEGSRFGFSFENGSLELAIKQLNNIKNVKVVGIHIHYTAQTRSLSVYKVLAQKACEISKLFDYELKYIDIGGGFFGGVPNKPSYYEYMSLISRELSKEFDSNKTQLIIEPGSAIIGSPIDFVCTVVDVKDTFSKRIVTVNGSRNNIDPFFKKTSYFYSIKSKNENIIPEQIICGYTCLDYDRIFKLENEKELFIGDEIIFNKVGAYTMSLSPLFIEYFPDIYVEKINGTIDCVRKKWGVGEYIQNCNW